MAQSGSFNLLFDRTAGGGQESSSDDTSDEDSPPQGVDFSLLACLNLSSAEKREASSGSVEEKPDKGDRETTQGRQGNDKAKTGKKKVKAKATEAPPEQVPVKQAEEDFRIELINIFKAFQKSKAQEYLFPRDLSNLQRKFIHAESKKYGFKSKSTGKGEKRFLRLTKYMTLTTKDSIEKKFELHESSLQVLRDLLQKHPPSAQELFNSAELQMTSEYNHHKKHASRKGKRKGGGNRAELWSTEKVAAELEALRLRRKERRCAAVQRTREALPISARKREILDLVRNNQIVLLAGETGCGKTTQVPQIIAESCWEEGKPCRVVCTQPRRISAISVAERIASERGESIGQSVGYSIRLEKKGTPQSSIVLCTNGVLLRQLVQKGHFRADDARNQSEGLVEGLTHLVVDEIHERDRFVDFILIILRDILPLNPNMKVVLMSATLQIDLLSSYFGNCPTIQVEGFMYPVEQFYLEDVLKFVGFAKAGGVSSEMAAPPELERAMMNAFIAGTDEAFEELMGEALAGAVEGATGSAPYVNAVHNTTGATALMVAAGKGRTDVCTVLIEHGADLGLASKDGKGKAKDWACKFGHHDLAEMLISREEESRKDRNKQSETASMLNQYQLSIDQDEVDLKIIVELISFLEEDQSFDVENSKGAILVFLPGWDEIIRLKNLLESSSLGDGLAVLPLHSMVPVPEQRKVFQKPPKGQRKVVLATNIAETAITIDDIVYVINSGRHKEKSYDPYTGVSTLLSSWTSRASEKQRKGRAGRCQPGVCFHIYSTSRSDSLLDFQIPELKRSPLEEVCLQIKVMESNGLPVTQTTKSGDSTVKTFLSRALEPPVPEAVQQALELLETIGALLPGEKLTVLGKHLASLPLPPQLGKLLFPAGCENRGGQSKERICCWSALE
ncbi:P-loop nucleoside triphosphate helicase [Chloropicon primus]|uniref:P-loop nucleoside triphosphate helicase n=1 Tax=Chloropicon primus TaxID=1764295 RepID=A0A5B8MD59_9CHLO|nr:P-loop nucleoside triphosphate helicase [Chloropicon primus]|eukprot:QDZ17545.1 P-loop nucleoside triphosphate helicase [Chloropicon primus]